MASQNTLSTLEALPTEILRMILSEMNCTDDLSAAIWASPRLFQCFLGWREQILIRVIESSLDPRIFMEVLGLLHVPNYGNLNYVPDPDDATFRDTMNEDDLDIWWFLSRHYAISTRVQEFEEEHIKRIKNGLERDAPQPFPTPRTRRPVDEEQLVQFRRSVNTVVEIFVSLKMHMEGTYSLSIAPFRDVWVPGTSSSRDYNGFNCKIDEFEIPANSMRVWIRMLSLVEQRQFLRVLLREKMVSS